MIDKLLRTEIETELEGLSKIEFGSEKHQKAVESVTKLMDRAIEMEKFDNELAFKAEGREIDEQLKREEMKNDQRDRKIKNWLTGASIASGVGVTVWGALKSWKFEETGSVVSTMGRQFMNKLANFMRK